MCVRVRTTDDFIVEMQACVRSSALTIWPMETNRYDKMNVNYTYYYSVDMRPCTEYYTCIV